jgi:hypothetical protein
MGRCPISSHHCGFGAARVLLALFEKRGSDHIEPAASIAHKPILEIVRSPPSVHAERGIVENFKATNEPYGKHLEKVRASGKCSVVGDTEV